MHIYFDPAHLIHVFLLCLTQLLKRACTKLHTDCKKDAECQTDTNCSDLLVCTEADAQGNKSCAYGDLGGWFKRRYNGH